MTEVAYLSTQDNLILVVRPVTVPSTEYDIQHHFVAAAAHNRLHYLLMEDVIAPNGSTLSLSQCRLRTLS